MTDENAATSGVEAAAAQGQAQAAETPEERVAGLERALAEARTLVEERGQAVAALTERAALATAKYRQAALAATPEVPPELVQGATVEEVDAAMARAKALVDEVRKRAVAHAAETPRTPAGAPARSAPDLSGLTAQEKIAHGLARRG
ncbi:MAG: hypothetical protein Q7T26_04445 [Dehalococcoidia bacterium]|nr:hypothetical protein [Dehalococcoidia bacterium]